MLRSRIIPVLLVRNHGLVKTVKFSSEKYVGDPLNAVRIFNEKEADELVIIDIDATSMGNPINYNSIEHWAAECRMPLCYGGGVSSLENAIRILSLGVEKVAISSAAIRNPNIITEITHKVGRQSVVAVIDVKKTLFSGYQVYINNGKVPVKAPLLEIVGQLQTAGAGEIMINFIDRDGTRDGYDFDLVEKVKNSIQVPLTVVGGASDLNNIKDLVSNYSPIGAGVGSSFVFKGKYRAVLINYPNADEKKIICGGKDN